MILKLYNIHRLLLLFNSDFVTIFFNPVNGCICKYGTMYRVMKKKKIHLKKMNVQPGSLLEFFDVGNSRIKLKKNFFLTTSPQILSDKS